MAEATIYHVENEEALERARVGGANESRRGRFVELIPRMSVADYNQLMEAQGETAMGLIEEKLDKIPQLSSQSREGFLSVRRAMHRRDGQGVVIVPDVPQPIAHVDAEGDDQQPGRQRMVESLETAADRPKKTYSLSQIFTDVFILDKYGLSPKLIASVQRMAATKPDQAARVLESALQEADPSHLIKVSAGAYSRSKGTARMAVRTLAGAFSEITTASVETLVVGRSMFMFGPGGQDGWHVRGPLEYAHEILDIHKMVMNMGAFDPIFLLAFETALLRIDVYNGTSYENGQLTYHVGSPSHSPLPNRSSMEASSLMTTDARMKIEAMVDRVLPVTDGHVQVASAVRVTERHVLVNTHVVETVTDMAVGGITAHPMQQMSRDVWAYKCKGPAAPWSLREPRVGEMVVLCYRTGDRVQYTSPTTVLSCEREMVRTGLASDVRHGMSGAALVALDDLALLGVHSAVTAREAIAYRFGHMQFSQLLDVDQVSQASRDDATETADSTYSEFKRRGLARIVDSAIKSMTPVYVGDQFTGMAVNVGTGVVTTCDPDLPLRVGEARVPSIYTTVGVRKQYRADVVVPGTEVPTQMRPPSHYETVYVVGRDAEGPYFSEGLRVQHIGANAAVFAIDLPRLTDLPYVGGVIVAKTDGAVLGQYSHVSTTPSLGTGVLCYPVSLDSPQLRERPEQILQRRFPFLNLGVWSSELIEEVFTHASAGRYDDRDHYFNKGQSPLANVGDNIAKALLYDRLRRHEVDHSTWASIVQDCQSNLYYASVASKHGLESFLVTGPGARFPSGHKAYADMVEALIAAVWMEESHDTLVEFLDTIGALGVERAG